MKMTDLGNEEQENWAVKVTNGRGKRKDSVRGL
jgi:hypothetical protein